MDERQNLEDSMELDVDPLPAQSHGILRTRSLDESATTDAESQHTAQQNVELSPGYAMHSSFDASMLNSDHTTQQQTPRSLFGEASWDENDPTMAESKERKNLRAHFSIDMPELPPPGTVRKSSRRPGEVGLSRTPVRPRFRPPGTAVKKAVGKLTPASAKRRRAPLHQRRSPMQRMPPKTPRDSSARHAGQSRSSVKQQEHSASVRSASGAGFAALDTIGQSIHDATLYGTSTKKPSKLSLGTATTAASSLLETTHDTADSVETSDTSTPFRFTSFPASLPRINNNANAEERQCPVTVRKRMSFGDRALNQSGDDEGTHNTSISSIADEVNFGYSDTESAGSPVGTPVTRTKLNFNSVLSPAAEQVDSVNRVFAEATDPLSMQVDTEKVDLSRPYDQVRVSSFASSVSSHTAFKNTSGCDDINTTSTVGLTPSRSSGFPEPRVDIQRPETPREVQLHFQLDAAQCSPIPGIPEEDGDVSSKSEGFCARKSTAKTKLSTSHESGSTSSGSSRMRRLRPLPDMNAFDADALSSSRDHSGDDTATTSSKKSHPPSPKLLCPPTPVRTPAWAHNDSTGLPIFKPGGHFKFHRTNSLVATKVLATCSPQVLDGRTSLENSILEEEGSKSGSKTPQSLSTKSPPTKESDTDTIVEDGVDTPMQDEDHSVLLNGADASLSTTLEARPSLGEIGSVVSMAVSFETLGVLGSGTFADVYKVRSRADGRLFAVKRNRRQFRGKRDREKALAEVRYMQRLQSLHAPTAARKISYSLYLLFFYQAWQEEGHFYCQTELCCRDTCRELLDSLRSQWNYAKIKYPSLRILPPPDGVTAGSDADTAGRLVPLPTIWKICHDISAGLSHIHSHGLVHFDLKPSNIFFVRHCRFGAMCKIGDFGISGEIGSSEDGQEGDQKYMAPELLSSSTKHPSADIFSLGLTLYELASDLTFEVPSEGPRWHELRSGRHVQQIPLPRGPDLVQLIQLMMHPDRDRRPSADLILTNDKVAAAGTERDNFLLGYIQDIEEGDRQDERDGAAHKDEQTPRIPSRLRVCSPPAAGLPPVAPNIYSPEATSS